MSKNALSIYLCYHKADFPVDSIHKKSWIDVFKQTLKVLFIQSGLATPAIYEEEDGIVISNCDICLVVLSENMELNLQNRKQLQEVIVKNKAAGLASFPIFKIMPYHVASDLQPDLLRNLPQYDFFEYDPDTELYYEYKNIQRSIDYRYWLKLDDLVYDIIHKHIKKSKNFLYTIYLASSTLDLAGAREEIKRNLKHWGYLVLPENPYATKDEHLLTQEIHSNIAKCQLSIHLFGEVYGDAVNEAGSSLPALENEIGAEYVEANTQLQRLIWLPKGQEVLETKQQTYIEYIKMHRSMRLHTECLETSFEHFKDYIHFQLNQLDKPKLEKQEEYLFGITASDKVDWTAARQWAKHNQKRFYTFHNQSDWFMAQSLMGNAKAIILATQGGQPNWLQYWSKALLKLVGYREKSDRPMLFWLDEQKRPSPYLSKQVNQISSIEEALEHLKT